LKRSDYNKSIRNVNEKRLKEKIDEFKRKNIIFKYLPKQVLSKIIHVLIKSTFKNGEYLYKQFDKSKYIYFIDTGKIEISLNLNISELSELINHINETKLNILKVLTIKGEITESTLEKLIEPSCIINNFNLQYISNFSFR